MASRKVLSSGSRMVFLDQNGEEKKKSYPRSSLIVLVFSSDTLQLGALSPPFSLSVVDICKMYSVPSRYSLPSSHHHLLITTVCYNTCIPSSSRAQRTRGRCTINERTRRLVASRHDSIISHPFASHPYVRGRRSPAQPTLSPIMAPLPPRLQCYPTHKHPQNVSSPVGTALRRRPVVYDRFFLAPNYDLLSLRFSVSQIVFYA